MVSRKIENVNTSDDFHFGVTCPRAYKIILR
jgi:hypothetical protein